MDKKLWFWLLVMPLVCMATFCHIGNASSAGSYVKILKIEPNPSVPLKSGSEVHFKVNIEYKVTDDSATVNLLIQKGEYSGGIDTVVGSTMQVLTKGKGTVTLEKTVTVPNTNVLQVFTPLMIPGQTSTTIVDMKYYKVIK
jgi:hypothetical protein